MEGFQVSSLLTRSETFLMPNGHTKQVDDAMRPLDQIRTITIDTPITKALEIMGRDDINQLPVMLNGTLQGIITRSHILQLIQTRRSLVVEPSDSFFVTAAVLSETLRGDLTAGTVRHRRERVSWEPAENTFSVQA